MQRLITVYRDDMGSGYRFKCNGMTKTQFDFIFVMREKGFSFSELLFYCK